MIFKSLELFYNKVQADPVLVKYVRNIKVNKVVEHQKRIIMVLFGGTPGVELEQIKITHKKLFISDNEFDSLKELIRETFEQVNVGNDLINESLELIEKYRGLIVADTVYEQIGGEKAMKKLVEFQFEKILADPELRLFFLTSNVEKVKSHMVTWLSQLFGGNIKYRGRDLREAHKNMELTDRHFYLMKKHLAWGFHKIGVTSAVIDKALDMVEKDRTPIIGSKTTYEELGEDIGLRQIIDAMMKRAMHNPMLKAYFNEHNVERISNGLFQFMAKELGDPAMVNNTTVDLKMIHTKLNLADFHLDALQNCIEEVLKARFTNPVVIRDVLWNLDRYRRKVCCISIYDLVGGDAFIASAAKILHKKVKYHYRLAKYFKALSDEQLTQLMKHLITYSIGGRRSYRGRDMKNAHEFMEITNEHFQDMRHLLKETFKELGVVDSLILQVLSNYDDKKRYIVMTKKEMNPFSLGEESLID